MKLTFFSRAKPRGFNYKPIHYDPAREAREQRRKELLGEDAESPLKEKSEYVPGEYIRSGGIRRSQGGIHSRLAQKNRSSSIRGAVALGVLLAMCMWLMISIKAGIITLVVVLITAILIMRQRRRKQ